MMNYTIYTPMLGYNSLHSMINDVQIDCSNRHITLKEKGNSISARLPDGYVICRVTKTDRPVLSADKEVILDRLVDLRKRITEGSGNWGEENMAMMWDVAEALGFDDIDKAYISGDIDELYRKAR